MKGRMLILLLSVLLFSSCTPPQDAVIDLNHARESMAWTEKGAMQAIINKNSGTYHLDEECRYLASMKEENRLTLFVESAEVLLAHGYKACKGCAAEAD